MSIRNFAAALFITSLLSGISQAVTHPPETPPASALSLEEQLAYSLVGSMLSLAAANVEHTEACHGSYDAYVNVTNWRIGADGSTRGSANSSIDDFDMHALLFATQNWKKKGVSIEVSGTDGGAGEVGNTKVRYRALFAFDPDGSRMVGGPFFIELDGNQLDPQAINGFWDTAEVEDNNENRGRELIAKEFYRSGKWKQKSFLRRSNGGDGRIQISRDLIAPDKIYDGCRVSFSARVGNLGGGFQTIGGKIRLTADGNKPAGETSPR